MGSLMHQSDPSPTRVDVEASLLIIGPLLTGEVVKGSLVLFFCFVFNAILFVMYKLLRGRREEERRIAVGFQVSILQVIFGSFVCF